MAKMAKQLLSAGAGSNNQRPFVQRTPQASAGTSRPFITFPSTPTSSTPSLIQRQARALPASTASFAVNQEISGDFFDFCVNALRYRTATDRSLLRELIAYAINKKGTVTDYERIFIAALFEPTFFESIKAGSLVPIPPVSEENLQQVIDFGRQPDLAEWQNPSDPFSLSIWNYLPYETQLSIRFNHQKANLTLIQALNTINAMASDPLDWNDGLAAGIILGVLLDRDAGDPLIPQFQQGNLKVDSVPRQTLPDSTKAGYSTISSGTFKGRTIYVPNDLDPTSLADRFVIIHELTHARDDFARPMESPVLRVDYEWSAYEEEARYILDEITQADSDEEKDLHARAVIQDGGYFPAALAYVTMRSSMYRDAFARIYNASPVDSSFRESTIQQWLFGWPQDMENMTKAQIEATEAKKGNSVYITIGGRRQKESLLNEQP